MRESNPFQFLHLACRWMLPWTTSLAISALIAHVVGAMLAPSPAIETGTRVTSGEQSASSQVEARSASVPSVEGRLGMTRVWCPSEPDVTTDTQVVSLQDLDLLMTSLCVVRPGESR
jgi:hypothetical protein